MTINTLIKKTIIKLNILLISVFTILVINNAYLQNTLLYKRIILYIKSYGFERAILTFLILYKNINNLLLIKIIIKKIKVRLALLLVNNISLDLNVIFFLYIYFFLIYYSVAFTVYY